VFFCRNPQSRVDTYSVSLSHPYKHSRLPVFPASFGIRGPFNLAVWQKLSQLPLRSTARTTNPRATGRGLGDTAVVRFTALAGHRKYCRLSQHGLGFLPGVLLFLSVSWMACPVPRFRRHRQSLRGNFAQMNTCIHNGCMDGVFVCCVCIHYRYTRQEPTNPRG